MEVRQKDKRIILHRKPSNPYSEKAKIVLSEVLWKEREIAAILEEMERLHAMRTRITSTLREVTTSPTGFNGDKRADATARLIDLNDKLRDRVKLYAESVESVMQIIDGLHSDRQREVMQRRYVLGWTFPRIAADLGIELDTAYHLHGRALYNVGKSLSNNETA
jgi:DNA-directed RNA polymerase specialized sigma24 family protein|nr:MAG TPA_asm: Protein of unknown function (DUF722) [Caudoviricetes sp.]